MALDSPSDIVHRRLDPENSISAPALPDGQAGLQRSLEKANSLLSKGLFAEAQALCVEAIAGNPMGTAGLLPLQELHIRALYSQSLFADALRAYRILTRSLPPGDDPEFDDVYYEALKATASPPVPLRRRPRYRGLIDVLCSTAHLTGDVAECGCFMGLSSYLICRYMQLTDEGFVGEGYHVFDSFEGLSAPTSLDLAGEEGDDVAALALMRQTGAFAAPLDHVRRALSRFPEIAFHPGWLPGSLQGLPERRYRFVHIDVDLHDPTRGALEYFYPRLVTGGCIVSDDFGWPGARQAISAFADENGVTFEVNSMDQATIRRA